MKKLLAVFIALSTLTVMQAQASVVCQQNPGENEPSLVVRLDGQGSEWMATATYVDTYLVQRIGTYKTSVSEVGQTRVITAPGLKLSIDTASKVRKLYNRAQVQVVSQYSGKVWTAELLCQ